MVCFFVFLIGLSGFIRKARITKDLRVGLGAFLLAKGGHNIDKALVILHIPLGLAHLLFLLFGHWDSDPASARDHGLHL